MVNSVFTFVLKVVVPLKSFLWGGELIAMLHILLRISLMDHWKTYPMTPKGQITLWKFKQNIIVEVGLPDDWWTQEVPPQKGLPSRTFWGGIVIGKLWLFLFFFGSIRALAGSACFEFADSLLEWFYNTCPQALFIQKKDVDQKFRWNGKLICMLGNFIHSRSWPFV